MVVIAHGRTCLEPRRLGLRTPWRQVNLDEFYRAGHRSEVWVNLYCTMPEVSQAIHRHSGNAANHAMQQYHLTVNEDTNG